MQFIFDLTNSLIKRPFLIFYTRMVEFKLPNCLPNSHFLSVHFYLIFEIKK